MEFTPASARRVALLAAIALHVIVGITVLQLRPVPASPRTPEPLIVRWIEPEPIKPPPPPTQPKPQPPKPVVKRVEPQVTPKPVKPPPPLITTEAAPAGQPFVAPPATPAPPEPPPAQAVAAVPKATEGPPAPLPITPPSFDAAYLNNPAPPYPSASRRLGEAGRVVLRVLVTPGGAPEQVEVRTSSKSSRLDEAAMRAVQRWKFVPARQGEKPVSAWVLVPIVFTLEG